MTGDNHPNRPKWNNTISTGNALQFFALLGAIIAAWMSLQVGVKENAKINQVQDQRFIEVGMAIQAESDRQERLLYREIAQQTARSERIEEYLIRIENKLDRYMTEGSK